MVGNGLGQLIEIEEAPKKNIESILQRLIRILSQEIVTYTKLLTSLEEKQQAIIQGKVEQMQILIYDKMVMLTLLLTKTGLVMLL